VKRLFTIELLVGRSKMEQWVKSAGLFFASSLTVASMAPADDLRIYNWADYIDPALIDAFEAETGLDVVYAVYDSNAMVETKVLAGEAYDIVVPSHEYLGRMIDSGAFQTLDRDKLPNLVNMWDEVEARTAAFDPDNAYSINYMWGTTGLGVNVGRVAEILGPNAPVDSWSLIFDPANAERLASCGIYVADAPVGIFSAVLVWLGESPEASDTSALERAAAALKAIRPHVRNFTGADSQTALASGDICVALGWSGDILRAADIADEAGNGVDITYHIPKEGAPVWFDQMAVPANAPNPDGAHAFLNFMMVPENIAAATRYVRYANGNLASQALLDEETLGTPAIYPGPKAMEGLFVAPRYPEDVMRHLGRLWTSVRTGEYPPSEA
jgi:putrescine transport system substrate-binding protein